MGGGEVARGGGVGGGCVDCRLFAGWSKFPETVEFDGALMWGGGFVGEGGESGSEIEG